MNSLSDTITLAHGSGGAAMATLINDVVKPIFDNAWLNEGEDQARLPINPNRLAMTTDSYVISPIEFPGGDIGKLAVCGTLNDLSVGGAVPKYLSVGLILEEGLPISRLKKILQSMQAEAKAQGVAIVTGDTKVVPRGAADQIYINTTGVGYIPEGRALGVTQIQSDDVILVNNQLGNHGAVIADVRDSLGFTTDLKSDCASLNELIQQVLKPENGVRCIRDATRGGVAAVLNEFSQASDLSIQVEEASLPVHDAVKALCELLGFDPLYLANEGNAVWVVDAMQQEEVLAVMRAHPLGKHAAVIGRVTEVNSRPLVTLKNPLGVSRVIDRPMGELLPRIC